MKNQLQDGLGAAIIFAIAVLAMFGLWWVEWGGGSDSGEPAASTTTTPWPTPTMTWDGDNGAVEVFCDDSGALVYLAERGGQGGPGIAVTPAVLTDGYCD